jgi:hypothetical protein
MLQYNIMNFRQFRVLSHASGRYFQMKCGVVVYQICHSDSLVA